MSNNNLPTTNDIEALNNQLDKVSQMGRQTVLAAWEAGEMLNTMKAKCPHGTWKDWIAKNVTEAYRTCAVYMQINSKVQSLHISKFTSIQQALEHFKKPKSKPAEPKLEPITIEEYLQKIEEPLKQLHLESIKDESSYTHSNVICNIDGLNLLVKRLGVKKDAEIALYLDAIKEPMENLIARGEKTKPSATPTTMGIMQVKNETREFQKVTNDLLVPEDEEINEPIVTSVTETEIAITDASTNNQQPVKEPEPKPTTFNATVESRDKQIIELIDEIDALQLQLDNEPADISNFSIKNIYNMYPPAHRKKLEARKQNNNLPNFSDTLFTQIESKIQASLNKLDRPTAQKVMKSLADIMNAMDIVSKSVLDELLPEYISQTDIKLAARQKELDEREAELIKGKVTIPNNILGRGYTHEEVRRLKSAIHPDTTSSPEKKTEAFQLLERVFPSEANQRKSNKAQENA